MTILLAGVAGIEPAITGSKPGALPLGYTPIYNRLCQGDANIVSFIETCNNDFH